ncbi:hypothetical protein E3N88_00056 [Mikania micrantha]|uniref:Uncharacterized protein n=1 Tax=Mikania micrantha TaxID=192012 RepID=A0A5N6PZS1_9ASTR|nr:hypothetical protein E3N88_00056 [Mikania micrantha]
MEQEYTRFKKAADGEAGVFGIDLDSRKKKERKHRLEIKKERRNRQRNKDRSIQRRKKESAAKQERNCNSERKGR